jgi:hypothetical protein
MTWGPIDLAKGGCPWVFLAHGVLVDAGPH